MSVAVTAAARRAARAAAAAAIVEPLEDRTLLTTYYVSPSGNDGGPGTAIDKPWKSLSKVNKLGMKPGDKVLLQGGATFTGWLWFDFDDVGTSTAPITLSTYGTGKATINSGLNKAIVVRNVNWFNISNLDLVGSGRTVNTVDGLSAYADVQDNSKFTHLYLDNLQASGFGINGIAIGGLYGTAGFKDVRITNTTVKDNGINGLIMYGAAPGANQDIYIGHCRAMGNAGNAAQAGPSGSGILIHECQRALVERCVATNNGFAGNGGVGIWSFASDSVTLQYNESYRNRTSADHDGGGFAFDGGSTNCVMQYNYSHDNDGAGYGLFQYYGATTWKHNTVRYNISQNDGRRNGYNCFQAWSGFSSNTLTDGQIYNNTFFMSPSASGGTPRTFRLRTPTVAFRVRNNIFFATGGCELMNIVSGQNNLIIQNNDYWTAGGSFKIVWGSTTYTSLSAFRATGQEVRNGAPVGYIVDPKLTSPGGGPTFDNADLLGNLTAYKLQSTSPMINTAQNLLATVNVNPGSLDFYGNALPQGGSYDIGAHEWKA